MILLGNYGLYALVICSNVAFVCVGGGGGGWHKWRKIGAFQRQIEITFSRINILENVLFGLHGILLMLLCGNFTVFWLLYAIEIRIYIMECDMN